MAIGFTKFKLTPSGGTKSYYYVARQNPAWVDAIEPKTGIKAVTTDAEKGQPTCKVSELIRHEKAARVKIRYEVNNVFKYAVILVDASKGSTASTTLIGEPWGGGTIKDAIGVTRDRFT